jgi:hypothetical protein
MASIYAPEASCAIEDRPSVGRPVVHPFRRYQHAGAALKLRLAVNGIQWWSRVGSLEVLSLSISKLLRAKISDDPSRRTSNRLTQLDFKF